MAFSEDIRAELLSRLANGESLRAICKSPRMPAWATVGRWLEDDADFRAQYARARETQADAIFDEILEIADEATGETVNQARLRIDARKWMAGKLRPKKYGDKLAIGGADDLPPVQTLDASKLPTEVLRQIMAARE